MSRRRGGRGPLGGPQPRSGRAARPMQLGAWVPATPSFTKLSATWLIDVTAVRASGLPPRQAARETLPRREWHTAGARGCLGTPSARPFSTALPCALPSAKAQRGRSLTNLVRPREMHVESKLSRLLIVASIFQSARTGTADFSMVDTVFQLQVLRIGTVDHFDRVPLGR